MTTGDTDGIEATEPSYRQQQRHRTECDLFADGESVRVGGALGGGYPSKRIDRMEHESIDVGNGQSEHHRSQQDRRLSSRMAGDCS